MAYFQTVKIIMAYFHLTLFRGLLATSPLALAALARAGLGVGDSRQPARR
jgi:hypothetical protein